jgi:hypothetical protein
VKVWSVLFRDGAELLAFIVPRVMPQGVIAKWAGYRVIGEARFGGFRCVRLRLRLKHRHPTNAKIAHTRLGLSYLERAWRLHDHKWMMCQPTENPRNPPFAGSVAHEVG